MKTQTIHFLEELAANAWPAAVIQIIDGWRLRFTGNVHRRVNSVWPNENNGRSSLETKLALVEEFYQRHNVPSRFQICPAAQPAHLDTVLAERGYVIDAPTNVQTAVLDTVLQQTTANYSSHIATHLGEDWFNFDVISGNRSQHAATVRRGIMQRIGTQTAFVSLKLDGQIIGIGLGVYERHWLGLFGMRTHTDYRRRGVATAVLHQLAQWGSQQGAVNCYLQVEQDNPTAQKLYERVGFETQYAYHYRQL